MDTTKISFLLFALTFLAVGCATTKPKIPTDMTSSQPGTQVSFKGNPLKLLKIPPAIRSADAPSDSPMANPRKQ